MPGYAASLLGAIFQKDETSHTRAVCQQRRTARVIPESQMAESERARQLRQYAERLAELRRYL
jgi:hypothetical protein